ncbi:hypothetical protein [Pseudaestuariivita atlantica]|uniref:Uncharacterized protein n=1 Tax=Pseudaestuariivita atlantica TaxID=1317121 RepID=A0A0L1JS64_9RHOB|nr:hypothetical protein [Pseudaestuariivita atlantica]KNG94590.1 hypothetical protein ATO11_04075 [Pseudaestuariivita atlantica]
MTHTSYLDHLESRLKEIERALARENKTLEHGDIPDKVEALESLTKLEQRRRRLEERLETAREKHSETWSEAHAGFREELDGIEDTIEKLILG